MRLAFKKYHGLGNDFVVVSGRALTRPLTPAEVGQLCDRHRGIGADGVLTAWPDPEADVRMAVQNADGSESAMCGNGIRCLAQWLADSEPASARRAVRVRAGDGVYSCEATAPGRWAVAMGRVRDEDLDLPPPTRGKDELRLEHGGQVFEGTRLSLGNPHFVVFGESTPLALAERFGPALERHPAFPRRVNVSFARLEPGTGMEAAVYERGAGITQACGSGACAITAAAVRRGLWRAGVPAAVRLPGGTLSITVAADGAVRMEGDAVFVFAGEVSV